MSSRTVSPAPETVLDELAQGTERGIHDGVRSPATCRETGHQQNGGRLRAPRQALQLRLKNDNGLRKFEVSQAKRK